MIFECDFNGYVCCCFLFLSLRSFCYLVVSICFVLVYFDGAVLNLDLGWVFTLRSFVCLTDAGFCLLVLGFWFDVSWVLVCLLC